MPVISLGERFELLTENSEILQKFADMIAIENAEDLRFAIVEKQKGFSLVGCIILAIILFIVPFGLILLAGGDLLSASAFSGLIALCAALVKHGRYVLIFSNDTLYINRGWRKQNIVIKRTDINYLTFYVRHERGGDSPIGTEYYILNLTKNNGDSLDIVGRLNYYSTTNSFFNKSEILSVAKIISEWGNITCFNEKFNIIYNGDKSPEEVFLEEQFKIKSVKNITVSFEINQKLTNDVIIHIKPEYYHSSLVMPVLFFIVGFFLITIFMAKK